MAPTAAYADALATAFMVLGAEQTKDSWPYTPELGLDVLLMSTDGQGGLHRVGSLVSTLSAAR